MRLHHSGLLRTTYYLLLTPNTYYPLTTYYLLLTHSELRTMNYYLLLTTYYLLLTTCVCSSLDAPCMAAVLSRLLLPLLPRLLLLVLPGPGGGLNATLT